MYAILQQGGHQYRVAPGDRLLVDRLGAAVGSVISLAPVLLMENDGATTVGTPVIEGASVAARVVAHPLGAKLRVFTYKPKKRHRRTFGHRSRLTELRVEALLSAGDTVPESTTTKAQPARKSRGRADATSDESTPSAGSSARARGRRGTASAQITEASEEAGLEAVVEAPAEASGSAEERPTSAPSRRPRRTSKPASTTSAETEE